MRSNREAPLWIVQRLARCKHSRCTSRLLTIVAERCRNWQMKLAKIDSFHLLPGTLHRARWINYSELRRKEHPARRSEKQPALLRDETGAPTVWFSVSSLTTTTQMTLTFAKNFLTRRGLTSSAPGRFTTSRTTTQLTPGHRAEEKNLRKFDPRPTKLLGLWSAAAHS